MYIQYNIYMYSWGLEYIGIYCAPHVVRVAFLLALLEKLAKLIAMLIKMLLELHEGHNVFQYI